MQDNVEPIATPPKKVKIHKRTKDCEHLIAFMKRFNMKSRELSEVLGQGPGAVAGWLGKRDAPLWTHLAIEALVRRHKGSGEITGKQLFILELPSSHVDTTKKVLEAFGGVLTKIERS